MHGCVCLVYVRTSVCPRKGEENCGGVHVGGVAVRLACELAIAAHCPCHRFQARLDMYGLQAVRSSLILRLSLKLVFDAIDFFTENAAHELILNPLDFSCAGQS